MSNDKEGRKGDQNGSRKAPTAMLYLTGTFLNLWGPIKALAGDSMRSGVPSLLRYGWLPSLLRPQTHCGPARKEMSPISPLISPGKCLCQYQGEYQWQLKKHCSGAMWMKSLCLSHKFCSLTYCGIFVVWGWVNWQKLGK